MTDVIWKMKIDYAPKFFRQRLKVQIVQLVHQLVEIVLFSTRLAGLASRDPYAKAHGGAAVFHQFDVSFHSGQFNRARGAEKLREIDFQTAGAFARRACDGRRLVFGKDDGVLRTDATAGGATALAVILVLNQDPLLAVDPVYAEEAKINALKTVRASAVIDDRIPAIRIRLSQHDR